MRALEFGVKARTHVHITCMRLFTVQLKRGSSTEQTQVPTYPSIMPLRLQNCSCSVRMPAGHGQVAACASARLLLARSHTLGKSLLQPLNPQGPPGKQLRRSLASFTVPITHEAGPGSSFGPVANAHS